MKATLVLLSLLAVCILRADGLPNAPYLYAIGFSSRNVAADQIRLSFSLVQREKDAPKATAAVEEKARKVFAILANFEVTAKDISAASVSTRLRYDEDKGKEFLGYEVERNFGILLRNVARYGELAKALLDVPVDGLSLAGVSSSREDVVAKEVEEEARKAARRNAEVTAMSFDAEVIGVYAISPVSFSELSRRWPHGYTDRDVTFAAQSAGSRSLSFVLPPVTIGKEAHVIFLIREKKKEPNQSPQPTPGLAPGRG